VSLFDNSYVTPSINFVRDNVAALNALKNLTPAQDRVRVSLARAGQTILDQVSNGFSINSDDAKNWLNLTKQFAARISSSPGAAAIGATADQGQGTVDDSLTSGGQVIANAVTSAIHNAAAELEQMIVTEIPWAWVALFAAAVFILPSMLAGGDGRRR